jgi:hypothetical protein
MRNKMMVRMLGVGLLLALVMLVVPAALAQEEGPAIVLTEEGVIVPEGLTAGIVPLRLQNDAEEAFFLPYILGLNEGYTVEDLETALMENPDMPPEWVVQYGGTGVAPASFIDARFLFEAGDYVVLDFGAEMPTVTALTIAEATEEQAELPEADVTVSLLDFAFSIPAELSAGPQWWEFVNEGGQWHELALIRLADDSLTQDDLLELMMTSEDMPEGMEMVFNWMPVSEGTTTWASLDLEPGHYAVICFLPDIESEEMTPHAMEGMISLVTVSE